MASRLKNPWKKFLADATSSDHQQQQEQQQQQQQQEQQQQQQQQSSIPDSSSSSSSSATSSGANVPANSPLTGSDSFGLKTTKEKLKIIGLPSNFRKLRMKFLRHKKEATGSKEENTQFEKVAVQQRPARSKKKKQSVLKWKEGAKPLGSVSADENKEKNCFRKNFDLKKKKRQHDRRKKKLKLSKSLTGGLITEIEKEQKAIEKESKTTEKEEAETEMDAEEQTVTEVKDEETEFEPTFDGIERKKKEIPSTSSADSIPVGSKTPPELSLIPPQFTQESTSTYLTIKGSQEYITPIISSNQEPALLVAAETAGTSNVTSSTGTEFDMMFDAEPVILSTPACQVLGIIMNKHFFKNAAPSEAGNDLIRMYFAGKIPPGREKDAQETLEKAVGLAVTRVKSCGLSEDLYNFLNNNRAMAISLIIDAMKYRKKEFLPEFWTYDRMSKKEPPSEPPS